MNIPVDIAPDQDLLVRRAAEKIAFLLMEAIRLRGTASLVLSGGTTPRRVYELLTTSSFAKRIEWSAVHLFWGDERCVPPHSPESNYRMVREAFLDRAAIPPSNIHRIETELPPETAAARYEEEVRQAIPQDGRTLPAFDLIMLGLGEDGHTASLFPGTQALEERDRLVTCVYVERLETYRITMTFPLINNARNILFLVSGKGKAEIVRNILTGGDAVYPAQMVRPVSGNLVWMVDSDAASLLEKVKHS
ncbi:MAG: pgl [Bacteroidetes bacterium]|nr:pgl [Bacteroidota bacterium]